MFIATICPKAFEGKVFQVGTKAAKKFLPNCLMDGWKMVKDSCKNTDEAIDAIVRAGVSEKLVFDGETNKRIFSTGAEPSPCMKDRFVGPIQTLFVFNIDGSLDHDGYPQNLCKNCKLEIFGEKKEQLSEIYMSDIFTRAHSSNFEGDRTCDHCGGHDRDGLFSPHRFIAKSGNVKISYIVDPESRTLDYKVSWISSNGKKVNGPWAKNVTLIGSFPETVESAISLIKEIAKDDFDAYFNPTSENYEEGIIDEEGAQVRFEGNNIVFEVS